MVAEEVLNEALAINRTLFGRSSIQAASSLNMLAVTIALDQRRLAEAIALYREAFEIREHISHPDAQSSFSSFAPTRPAAAWSDLGATVDAARSPARTSRPPAPLEAMPMQRESMAEVETALREAQRFAHTQYAKDSWEEAFYLALTVWVQLQEKKYEEAENNARQCLAIRLKLRPDDWSVFHTRHLLGAAQAGQKRFTEAEPLLIDGYHGMKQRRASMPDFHLPRLGESALRIIDFYTELQRPGKVAEWKAEFDGLDEDAKQTLVLKQPVAGAARHAVISAKPLP